MALKDLLKKPFGPYEEKEALTDKVPNSTPLNPVELHEVILEWGGKYTGLTECEDCMPENRTDDSAPRRFMGTLLILSLSWLTQEAVKQIEKELSRRDRDARSANNPGPISLRSMYSKGGHLKVRVTIMGKRHLNVKYLDSTPVPRGLMMISKVETGHETRYHRYAVASLHIYSYELSRLYLSRFRLYHILTKLIELDANSNTIAANQTPLATRTPYWFVDRYMEHMAYRGSQRRHRAIYASSDSDIESGTEGTMRGSREHTLRHVSRAEVVSKIAEHAEWLIHQTEQIQNGKLFDVKVWKRWLPRVRCLRMEAAEAGRTWGVWDGAELPVNDDMDVDDLSPPPPPPPKPKKRKKKLTQRRPASASAQANAHASSSRNPALPVPPPVDADEASDSDVSMNMNPTMQRDYDSDFSPESSEDDPPSSDSDGRPPRPISPVDPDIAALMPPSFRRRPNLTATGKWACDVPHCRYSIDLLHPREEDFDTEELTESEKWRLHRRTWKFGDRWIDDALARMVGKHHEQHLGEWGIMLVDRDGEPMLKWKDERRKKSSLLRKVKQDDRRITEEVKQEDE
ncbi:hypothetical protein C8Q80DRAFT_1340674 [Daedaleopsis nitida]|nr:hypothetical protein C8Q80DRAFT_1340674 [Daedaleopsis nitida]